MSTELTLVWDQFPDPPRRETRNAAPTAEEAPVSARVAIATSPEVGKDSEYARARMLLQEQLAEFKAETARKHNMMLVGGLLLGAMVLNYLDRLHSQIHSLQLSMKHMR